MIRNDVAYRQAKARLADFREQIADVRKDLSDQRVSAEDIALATEPTEAIAQELEYEVNLYERLRSEGLSAVPSFAAADRGKALIVLRIARGWTQRQLADALGVSEAQVSRDERNDYHGITQERFARILQALDVEEVSRYQAVRAG